MKNFETILILLSFYALCERGKAKHVDLQFHPLSAKEVYEILEQANLTATIPVGRLIMEGIMGETRTSIDEPKSRQARILPIFGATSGEGQTVLQEICYSTRSLEHEDNTLKVDDQPKGRQAEEPTSGTGTTDTPTEPPPESTPGETGAPPTGSTDPCLDVPTPVTEFPPVTPSAPPPTEARAAVLNSTTPGARGLSSDKSGGDNNGENKEKEGNVKESEASEMPQGRQATPTPTFTTSPTTEDIPLNPTATTQCNFPASPSTSPPMSPTAVSPSPTPSPPSDGGVNCIKLEKPIRR